MHISGGVLFRGISDLPQGNVHHLREEDQDDQGQQQENHQCNIGNVQHAVAGFLDPQHVAVDDHIALYPVIVCDGRENAEHFRVEIAEEVIDHIVGGPGGGGVKIFDDDLVFNIQGHSRIFVQNIFLFHRFHTYKLFRQHPALTHFAENLNNLWNLPWIYYPPSRLF